jgi:hypothetical protein|tara:strand:- start:1444 stop:1845 length:402 start_codon:yes stop_codon:yes gene_type:complete
MKRLIKFFANIRDILIYSDSELLELALCLVLLVVNPLRMLEATCCLPAEWYFIGFVGGLTIIRGLGIRSVRCREIGMLLALVNLTALNVIEFRHWHLDPGYVLQNIVIAFTWWKLSRERMVKELRGGCFHGPK